MHKLSPTEDKFLTKVMKFMSSCTIVNQLLYYIFVSSHSSDAVTWEQLSILAGQDWSSTTFSDYCIWGGVVCMLVHTLYYKQWIINAKEEYGPESLQFAFCLLKHFMRWGTAVMFLSSSTVLGGACGLNPSTALVLDYNFILTVFYLSLLVMALSPILSALGGWLAYSFKLPGLTSGAIIWGVNLLGMYVIGMLMFMDFSLLFCSKLALSGWCYTILLIAMQATAVYLKISQRESAEIVRGLIKTLYSGLKTLYEGNMVGFVVSAIVLSGGAAPLITGMIFFIDHEKWAVLGHPSGYEWSSTTLNFFVILGLTFCLWLLCYGYEGRVDEITKNQWQVRRLHSRSMSKLILTFSVPGFLSTTAMMAALGYNWSPCIKSSPSVAFLFLIFYLSLFFTVFNGFLGALGTFVVYDFKGPDRAKKALMKLPKWYVLFAIFKLTYVDFFLLCSGWKDLSWASCIVLFLIGVGLGSYLLYEMWKYLMNWLEKVKSWWHDDDI